jgi:hypothetical protein
MVGVTNEGFRISLIWSMTCFSCLMSPRISSLLSALPPVCESGGWGREEVGGGGGEERRDGREGRKGGRRGAEEGREEGRRSLLAGEGGGRGRQGGISCVTTYRRLEKMGGGEMGGEG